MNYNDNIYYSRISALGPEGHCTCRFKKAVYFMSTACGRPQWGSGSCGQRDQKPDLFVDVINGWPLTKLSRGDGRAVISTQCLLETEADTSLSNKCKFKNYIMNTISLL